MAAVSYNVTFALLTTGQGLEAVQVGTNAPAAGELEIRIDQTATAITDAQSTTGTRALRKGEVIQLLNYLQQYLIRDTNVLE
jgi:Zn-dependent alcohol dehydrogenase